MNLERPKKTNEDFAEEEMAIISGEVTERDRLQKQMILATLLYKKLHEDSDIETTSGRNTIMEFWSDESDGKDKTYSKCFRKIEVDPEFENHPRLQGDISNITIEDVIYYKENDRLPEE